MATEGRSLPPFGHALAGAGGAVLALVVTYPLDIIKTRLQVQTADSAFSTKYRSATDALQQIWKTEGVSGLYAGLVSGVVGVASTNFAYFYWYSFIRLWYLGFLRRQVQSGSSQQAQIGVAMELLLGAVSGALAQLFTIPVSVVTTRQQTQVVALPDAADTLDEADDDRLPLMFKRKTPDSAAAAAVRPPPRRTTIGETFLQIVNEEGVTALWTGLRPSLVLTVNPAITYGLFEWIKGSLVRSRAAKTGGAAGVAPLEIFGLGVLSKTIATVVTYPYIMAKVRMQWKPADYAINDKVHYSGALDILTRILKTDGVAGWYKGMTAQIVKAVLSQALLFVIKDKLTLYTYLLYRALVLGGAKSKVK